PCPSLYFSFSLHDALPISIVAFFMMAAFYQVNGQPFLVFVEGAIKYAFSSKLYIWKKTEKKPQKTAEKKAEAPQVVLPKLSQSKDRKHTSELQSRENLVCR